MSARTINDSGDALPSYGEGCPEGERRPVAADAAARDGLPTVRTKRPRPTFDDGSITRVFKFPSKTYPRSSYYVTGTEIIVRIRKARKKWKLVIPKKRTASYRTNRWFAKPRWVEIELTYTQASRLGLVERRTAAKKAAGDTSAQGPVAIQSVAESDCPVTGDLEPCVETDITSDEAVLELGPEVGEPASTDDTDDASSELQVGCDAIDETE